MAQVTHKVVKGDTLSALAKKYGTTVSSIASLNNIKNTNRIHVGQVLVIKNKNVSSTKPPTKPSSSNGSGPGQVVITAMGLQADTDDLIYVTWTFNRTNTDHYIVEWAYCTKDGKWFNGATDNAEHMEVKESTYNAPSNAIKIRCRVKPISKTYNDKNNNEVSYWSSVWTGYIYYTIADKPPGVPPVPTVELNQYTMTMRNDNLDIDATEIEYYIVRDNNSLFRTGYSNIIMGSAVHTINIEPGYKYKVRARGKRGALLGDWSDFSDNNESLPDAPRRITELKAVSETAVSISWDKVNSAKTYSIQYAEKESYFEGSNSTTTIDSIETTTYIVTGLTSGTRYHFRIRACNESGNSGWSKSNSIAIGKKPEPPSTWSENTSVMIGEKVLLSWLHNSVDGSEQMASEINFEVNGVNDIYQMGMDVNGKPINTFDMPTFMFTDGTKVYWKVATKGVVNEFSDWSITRMLEMYAPPTISMSVNDGNDDNDDITSKITCFPLKIKATPGPVTQTPIMYYLDIRAKQTYITNTPFGEVVISAGDVVYSKVMTIQQKLDIEIGANEIDLENNVEYEITCMVTMDSGLSATATTNVTVDWIEKFAYPNAEVLIDKNKMSLSIRPYCERFEDVYMVVEKKGNKYIETKNELSGGFQNGVSIDDAITTSKKQVYTDEQNRLFCILEGERRIEVTDVILSAYRISHDGKYIEIGNDIMDSNTFVTDPHPSLNNPTYRIISKSIITGAVSYTDIETPEVGVKSIIIQWDESWADFKAEGQEHEFNAYSGGSILELPYNVNISENNTPDVNVVSYIGREHPVSYYGTALGVTSTWSTDIDKSDEDTLYAIRRLSTYMGDVYVREPSGVGYWANIKVSYDINHDALIIPITINLARVDGGV